MYDIFVISPYTHDDSEIVRQRVNSAEKYIVSLSTKGIVAYSSIAAFHHLIERYELPSDYEYWKNHCTKMIAAAKEVHVLCIDLGWKESKGVQDEIQFALGLGKDITFVKKP